MGYHSEKEHDQDESTIMKVYHLLLSSPSASLLVSCPRGLRQLLGYSQPA